MSSNSEKSEPGQPCEYQQNLHLLRQIPIFSPLPLDTLKVFAYLCARYTFKPGERILVQGEDDGQALFIISGAARLTHTRAAGETEVGEHGEGAFIGALSLLGKAPRLFSLTAIAETDCLMLSRDRFAKAIAQFPELMPKILNVLVDRIHRWERNFLADHDPACRECRKRSGVSLL